MSFLQRSFGFRDDIGNLHAWLILTLTLTFDLPPFIGHRSVKKKIKIQVVQAKTG
jgi:hypothetical protein